MRQQHGIAQRWQQHGRADLHPYGAGGDGCHQRHGVMPRPGGDAIADPDGIEAYTFGALGQRQQGRGLVLAGHDALARRQKIPDAGTRHLLCLPESAAA